MEYKVKLAFREYGDAFARKHGIKQAEFMQTFALPQLRAGKRKAKGQEYGASPLFSRCQYFEHKHAPVAIVSHARLSPDKAQAEAEAGNELRELILAQLDEPSWFNPLCTALLICRPDVFEARFASVATVLHTGKPIDHPEQGQAVA